MPEGGRASMRSVILLREPSEGPSDRYELAFSEAGYNPISLPVLETVHTHIPRLHDILLHGPGPQDISGVIITSKRSCEAFKEALQLVQDGEGEKKDVEGWDTIPFYVVGQTTATALADVFSSFSHLGLGSPDIRGQSSGNAASLATFILDDLKERPIKLLYLTGDKNRDTLPQLLNEGGITLESLQIYETRGSSSFEALLSSALSSSSEDVDYWWIVYFAPSAAAYVTPILRKHFLLEELDSEIATPSDLRRTKVAAIGPTTDTFLRDDLHLHVHAMAPKPTPDDVVSVIKNNDIEGL